MYGAHAVQDNSIPGMVPYTRKGKEGEKTMAYNQNNNQNNQNQNDQKQRTQQPQKQNNQGQQKTKLPNQNQY